MILYHADPYSAHVFGDSGFGSVVSGHGWGSGPRVVLLTVIVEGAW